MGTNSSKLARLQSVRCNLCGKFQVVDSLKSFWVPFISNLIWWSEKAFFYPKLAFTYKELDLNASSNDRNLVVFDVGANKGQSIKFFKKVYPESIIYAFEPSLRIFKALQENLEDMQVSGVSIFQFGLGNKSEVKDFYESLTTFQQSNFEHQEVYIPVVIAEPIIMAENVLLVNAFSQFEYRA